ncbi:MAG: dolichyl-phosphate-mannose--protein mannosyltransferase [Mycobacteriaceae bacterium]
MIAVTTVAPTEQERPDPAPVLLHPAPLSPAQDFGPSDRLQGWIATLFITAIAAITRFANLNYPTDGGTPVFDEKHYAPQGWQVLTGGWIEDNPGYGLVVHPPIGKLLIAFGEGIFGYNGWGWRFSSALAGTILVLLVVRIVRRLTRSTLTGAIAGILLIVDGVTFVVSRTALLDIFLVLFVTAAFGALIVDRDRMRERMHHVLVEGRITDSNFGPRLGVRWWRFGAGVLLGLGFACKWSGLYFIVFFGLLSVGFDIANRRAYGVRRPWLGTLIRDAGPALYALTLIPFLVYLASYWSWFASETGVNRHAVGQQIGVDGTWSFIPAPLRSLWYHSSHVLEFHSQLTNSAGNHHPWESKPWTWPMGLRPLLYYFVNTQDSDGCTEGGKCIKAVLLVGTPAMWWLAFPMLLWALWRMLVRHEWRYAAVLVSYGAAWLPWFANLDRQMYYFYAAAMAPFLIMGIALILGDIIHATHSAIKSVERQRLGLIIVCLYLGLVIANFIWLFPILTGSPISAERWNQEIWLPSWR